MSKNRLVPFASGWMGENGFAAWPVALYGVVLWLCGLGYFVLERALVGANGGEASLLAQAVGVDRKGLASMGLYLAAVAVAWVWPWVAVGVYVVVALMWVVPDQRIERRMKG